MRTLHTRLLSLAAVLLLSALAPLATSAEDVRLAPSFSVPNFRGGAAINLDHYQGKVVYVDFWASWCGPCLKSFPFMEELHRQYSDQGLVIIAINMDQNPQDAHKFLQDHPVTFAIGQNPAGNVAEEYGVMAMPTSFIVDRAGLIREVHYGFKARDKDKIAALISDLL